MAAAAPWGINAEEESSSSCSDSCQACCFDGPFTATISVLTAGTPGIPAIQGVYNAFVGTHTLSTGYSFAPSGSSWISRIVYAPCVDVSGLGEGTPRWRRAAIYCLRTVSSSSLGFVLAGSFTSLSDCNATNSGGGLQFLENKVITCDPFYYRADSTVGAGWKYRVEVTE